MKWLITGGCGFIGRNLIKKIKTVTPDACIKVVDNLSVGTLEDLYYSGHPAYEIRQNKVDTWTSNYVQVVRGNVVDPDLALRCSTDADIVIHLAANTGVGPSIIDPREDCITNVIGTFNYLEACRTNEIQKFIFASSGAPIGNCTPPIHEEIACHPISPYGASKLAGEGYCSAYHKSYGIDTVTLRFGNAYGPGSSHKESIIAKFIKQALNNEDLEIYGDGSQTRDFIFVEDIVQAILAASTKDGIGGEIFQIATNQETSILELSNKLVQILQENGITNTKLKYGPYRVGDALRNYSDTSKAKDKLGWVPEFSLLEGLKITLEEYLQGKQVYELVQNL